MLCIMVFHWFNSEISANNSPIRPHDTTHVPRGLQTTTISGLICTAKRAIEKRLSEMGRSNPQKHNFLDITPHIYLQIVSK